MPRGNRSSRGSGVLKEEPKPLVPEIKHGPFELVVNSFDGKLPGSEGYDAEKDRLMIGFKFGNSTVPPWMGNDVKLEEITAYDFLTNPKTGMRQGQLLAPHGAATTDLTRGISKWTDLPPLWIWRRGAWLGEIVWDLEFDLNELPVWMKNKVEKATLNWPKQGTPAEIYNYWVVSGEGTAGNNVFRLYEVPEQIAKQVDPKHPMMWPKALKDNPYSGTLAAARSWDKKWESESKATTTKPATTTVKAPSLPAGVRMRCPGCGHWYSMSDLPGHDQVCGKGDDADWAIMCHSDCGCSNLDQASTPKPGFPRPKPEPKEEPKEEEPVTSNGDDGA